MSPPKDPSGVVLHIPAATGWRFLKALRSSMVSKFLAICSVLVVPSGALACSYSMGNLPRLASDAYLLVGTVVDFATIEVCRKDQSWDEIYTGVVLLVEDPILDSTGEAEYEVYPMGIGADCQRSTIRGDIVRARYKVGTKVWVAAGPFHFAVDGFRPRVLLEAYRSGGMWPVSEEMADFDPRQFDFKYHRHLMKQREAYRGVTIPPGYSQFPYLVSVSQLEAATKDADRIEVFKRLARYKWLFDYRYNELVDNYVVNSREAKKLKDNFWRYR